MKFTILCLLMLLQVAAWAGAPKVGWTPLGALPPPEGHPRVFIDGKSVPPGSKCAAMLRVYSEQRGQLSAEQISELIPRLLALTGETLVDNTPPRGRSWGGGCFVGASRVLTPNGWVAIQDLKLDDEVISFVEETRRLVVNRIQQLHIGTNEPVGELYGIGLDGASVRMTPAHPYYSPSRGTYVPISQLEEGDSLLQIRGQPGETPRTQEFPRGPYVPQGRAKVFNMELESEPHNYILEECLVHNIKAKY